MEVKILPKEDIVTFQRINKQECVKNICEILPKNYKWYSTWQNVMCGPVFNRGHANSFPLLKTGSQRGSIKMKIMQFFQIPSLITNFTLVAFKHMCGRR